MRYVLTVLCVIALAVAAESTEAQPEKPLALGWFETGEFYACCHLRFDLDGNATDANLHYAFSEFMIKAGTKVKVTKALSGSEITMQPVGGSGAFTLKLHYGKKLIPAGYYFGRILLTSDPKPALADLPVEIRSGIESGQLTVGMTRAQAIMARGYPPMHHTPNLEAAEWLYYFSNGLVDAVRFVDGKIDSIERGPAP